MDYFKASIGFAKKNAKKSSIIILLDLVFYLLFIPIFNYWLYSFFRSINRMPLQLMGTALESLELETLQSLQKMLLNIFMGMMGSFVQLFILILINLAIFKGIIWVITLGKKIDYKLLLKGFLLNLVLAVVFLVPFILAAMPLFAKSGQFTQTQVLNLTFVDFIPLIIVLFLTLYFFTLAYYFFAKEGRFRKAFKNCFKVGVFEVKKLILPFVWFFLIVAVVVKLFVNLGLMQSWIGWFVIVLFVLVISFCNRIYVAKSI